MAPGISDFAAVVARARNAFSSGITKNVDFRVKQLNNFYKMCSENEELLSSAVIQDLQKPQQESILYEVEFLLNDIRCMKNNVRKWAKPTPTEKTMITLLDDTFIISEPYGVVLIIGAWNYPVQLSLSPMVGAIAAGNCVILKPSEISSKTASTIQELIPKYLDKECYHVVTGGPKETEALLAERFDYIFYTGSTTIGQKVREAANKHLTPVTLEMGGKSPVYLDETVDMDVACRRLLWGKFINAGQTCVAPDYLLCTSDVKEKLVPIMKKVIKEFYGENPQKSSDLGRIVNDKHFNRLLSLTKEGNIIIGGEADEQTRYIAPTVIANVKVSDPIMQEEIFGPLLPIITVASAEEAIDIINSKEKPLTLNVYSKRKDIVKSFLENTSSGSVCVNDSIVNLSVDALPFGGVGNSGMGCYHGKYSFDTFSHKKAVLIRNYSLLGEKLGEWRYPPYSESNAKYLRKLLKKRPNLMPPYMDYLCVFVLGFASAVIVTVLLHSP